jgi:hypothetical protein
VQRWRVIHVRGVVVVAQDGADRERRVHARRDAQPRSRGRALSCGVTATGCT